MGPKGSLKCRTWHTHATIDWHCPGPNFSTGRLPRRSSRSTTPKAYTSLLSVSLPAVKITAQPQMLKQMHRH